MPRLSSTRLIRSNARCAITRCPASASPTTPRANICTAAIASTAPRISDWMWPLESPLRIQSARNGVQAASAAIASTTAATVNTRSGSYMA